VTVCIAGSSAKWVFVFGPGGSAVVLGVWNMILVAGAG